MNLPARSPTHYHVLGISSSLLDSQPDPSILLKQAYRRALLRHHPDKARSRTAPPHPQSHVSDASSRPKQYQAASNTSSQLDQAPSTESAHLDHPFTIDQISTAFTTLSSPRLRAEYNASLRLSQSQSPALAAKTPSFQTGIESVDLDDLDVDEGQGDVGEGQGEGEGGQGQGVRGARWHRSCRCGNERGYLFGEQDLMQVEREGILMVGCQDCSLWLQVHFAVLDDDDDDDDVDRGGRRSSGEVEGEDDGDDGACQGDGRHRHRAQATSNGKDAIL